MYGRLRLSELYQRLNNHFEEEKKIETIEIDTKSGYQISQDKVHLSVIESPNIPTPFENESVSSLNFSN